MRENNNKLIVVLGVHRSGTSAITRGLQVMGVSLGDRLMPPIDDNNPKGFWEDIDLNALNIEMLRAIGSDWRNLAVIDSTDVEILRKQGYFLRAVELLRQKVSNVPNFGFKDPRVPKLLHFWKKVFSHCNFNVSYVMTVRHPLSVVSSLAKRDGIEAEQSYLLWLGHVITSLNDSAGDRRVVVDYDRLMQEPDRELMRVAKCTGLEIDPAALQIYKSEFIDQELRHTVYDLNDLMLDDTCPPIVREVYAALLDVASDKAKIDDDDIQKKVVRWSDEFERLKSPLRLVDKLLAKKVVADQTVGERDGQIVGLSQVVAERDGQIAELDQTVASLDKGVVERDGQIASLLSQFVAERDGQIDALNQTVARLNQDVAERDGQIAGLSQAVTERDRIMQIILASGSWNVTRPLRAVRSIFTGNGDLGIIQESSTTRFNAAWYLKQNPDVAVNGVDPYEHYVAFGKAEGRMPAPDPFLIRSKKRAQHIRTVLVVALRRIKHSGGIKPAINKALTVLKREGWPGIKRWLNFLNSQAMNPVGQAEGFDRNDYTEWVRRYDTLTDETSSIILARIAAFAHKPLISVVMPIYNPKAEWLTEAIESVRKQIYPHWELCIADDASTDKAVRPILERYAREDARIKVVFREKNQHISAASNSALELATGEWVALLDHDDLLTEHALFWVSDTINRHPEARLIYSDEDKIDESGRRFGPYFKCDWNADLFYSQNMFCHLGVYSTALLREIGGFRVGLEGAQDYDLALRCTEQIEPNQITHIPRVLYHWRMHAKSTAQSLDAKPYAMLAGERALNEHFMRRDIPAVAEVTGRGYKVRYALPDSLPLVSLIIPTRNGLNLIKQCIESVLEKTKYPNYEILIVDNASDDPATLAYFKKLEQGSRIKILHDSRPFNFSALNNAAVKLAQGEFIALLNNDLEVISPDWLSEMVSHALRPGVGAVGARLWYPNETLQHGGLIIGVGGVAGHAHKNLPRHHYGYFNRAALAQSFSAVTAACLVIRKTIYEEVGGLNETDLQIAFNDVDFCLRLREAGYRNIWTPFAELFHHESASRGLEDTREKQARFAKEVQYMKQRWGGTLLNDPAYSPNLTLDHEDFSLAWPPRVEAVARNSAGSSH